MPQIRVLKSWLALTVAFSFLTTTHASGEQLVKPIVKTQHGSLEGLVQTTRDGKPYYAFRGIPYAQFPGRFEVATTHASWNGVKSAKEFGSVCPQISSCLSMDHIKFAGEEMCLFLNIYTPTLDKNAGLPVMVWIHGGAFLTGSANGFDGKYFADENIIVISINYRLGPLGFLSFGEEGESMANIGMKDQVLALKWVSNNAQFFGGDASKVTVAGYSAGAASSHFHMLSKLSTGLFRAVISHSGAATAFWAIQQNPRENAIKLATALGCPVSDNVEVEVSTKDTISCLKSKPVEDITLAQLSLKEFLAYPIVPLAPVVESNGKDSFITELPAVALQNGRYNKVNWFTGFTEDDAAVFDIPLILNTTVTDILENEWETKAPIILGYQHLKRSVQDIISEKIRSEYFGQYEIEELTWSSLRNMLNDRYFIEPVVAAIQLKSLHSTGRVYPFIFRFSGNYSQVHKLFDVEGDHGVAHGDDLQYLFPGGDIGAPDYSGDTPVEIVEFSRKFVKLWANIIQQTVPEITMHDTISWEAHLAKPHYPVQFYEIAIETGIWDEDIQSRMHVWQELVKHEKSDEKLLKTEL